MTTLEDYRRALDAALREYETLGQQRAVIDDRLAQLAQTIGTLMRLCNMMPTVPFGLTDACRIVLKAAGHPLTAMEVRAQLQAMGFDLERYSSDLAAIHTVLKRLNEGGETRFVARTWDKPAYEWKRPVHTIALSESAAKAMGLKPVRVRKRGTKDPKGGEEK
jgi:hypothetical protein